MDEKHRIKMANFDLLHVLIKSLEDEEVRVMEAAGGVLANLTLSSSNHKIMVEAGIIPKLVSITSFSLFIKKILEQLSLLRSGPNILKYIPNFRSIH